VLVDNERQRLGDVSIFEIGSVHRSGSGGEPEQWQELGMLLAGDREPRSWAQEAHAVDAAHARGLVEWLAERIAHARVRWEPVNARDGVEHPGRTAAAVAELPDGLRLELGRAGELDPRYLAAMDVRAEQVAFARVSMEALARLVPTRLRSRPIPRVPATERDLAVVLPEDRPAGRIEDLIREAGGPLVRDVALFDRYQGPPLGRDEVSLAYRLRLQATERTLTEAEIDALMERIVGALWDGIGARIRR
jgi:phenylalanyl-tRNA synthetase beta chain